MIKELGKIFVGGAVAAVGSYVALKVVKAIETEMEIRKQIKENHKRSRCKILNFRKG